MGQATCLAVAYFFSISCGPSTPSALYRVVLLNFTPEIELFYMPFERDMNDPSQTAQKNTSISGVKSSWTPLYPVRRNSWIRG